MSSYQRRRLEEARRIHREYEEAKSLVRDWLEWNQAPKEIMDAFEKCANKPTVVWA